MSAISICLISLDNVKLTVRVTAAALFLPFELIKYFSILLFPQNFKLGPDYLLFDFMAVILGGENVH